MDSSSSAPILPWLYLDVDGVLNPDGPEFAWTDTAPRKGRIKFSGGYAAGYTLNLSRAQGAALATVPASLVWLTSWDQHANHHVGRRIGLPGNLPFLWGLHVPREEHSSAWKPAKLIKHLTADPRPFVSIDDDHDAIDMAAVITAADALGVPYLIVTTDPKVGLTADQIALIAEFSTSHVR